MKKTVLTLTIALLSVRGMSCVCDFTGNFLKVGKRADVIVVVEMIGYSDFVSVDEVLPTFRVPETITFKVSKVLKGSETRKEIKVFGDDGTLCRPSIQDFKKGKHFVVALYKCRNYRRASGTLETADHYLISICGSYSINYSPAEGMVTGMINRKRKNTAMRLDKLELMLNKK